MAQLIGTVTGNDSVAVVGTASQGERTLGVRGQGDSTGVQGIGKAWNGVEGFSTSTIGGAGVFGTNDTGVGVRGESKATYNPAIQGIHRGDGGAGIQGESENFVGVAGVAGRTTPNGVGVYGESQGQSGVYPPFAVGVWGNSRTGIGVFGSGSPAGWFRGSVFVRNGSVRIPDGDLECGKGGGTQAGTFNGRLSVTDEITVVGKATVYGHIFKGGGGFKIDHPLDPARKCLCHSFVESPEMKNLYDGVAVLNRKGQAEIKLPAWFEPLNQDFRYQLTPLGGPAPDLHIAKEIRGNRFKIAGGKPGMKVSWQVTGVRHDAYAKKHPIPVEETKAKADRGYYLHPEAHGQPPERAIHSSRTSAEKKPTKESGEPQVLKKGLKRLYEATERANSSRKSQATRK